MKISVLQQAPLIFFLSIFFIIQESSAQVSYMPYSYQHYQKYNDLLYSTDTRYHTSVKPSVLKGNLLLKEDSLNTLHYTGSENFFMRKIFDEHLIEIEKEDHFFYFDFLPDFMIGTELMGKNKKTTWMNTRGFQVGLRIKDNFTFYANAFENQAQFPAYLTDYITDHKVVPGQGTVKNLDDGKKDWMYATASLTYDFNDYFQATLAYDKNHIGDGYRSLLLSDFSSNYSHLKLSGKIGNVQYTSIWAYMLDPRNPRRDSLDTNGRYGDGIKGGAFQYLDYNVTNRFSIGVFQSIIWASKTTTTGIGAESKNSSSRNSKMFLGLNAKYKALDNVALYGQFLMGELNTSEFFKGNRYAHNKWATQIGLRGFDAFGIRNLNFLAEYNLARPYTYQHSSSTSNYSNHGEPLAHPLGANFKEVLALGNYSWNRFDFSLQGSYALTGTDPESELNMGGNIFQPYISIPHMNGNHIGQGVKNNLFYADVKASYILNPKYNLRLEIGYTQRYRKVEGTATEKSGVINVGLRSSFRNFYSDI